jgi:hypothetical protein
MPEWINKMNEMFANNAWTDDGRVKVIDYDDVTNTITIKVCSEIKNIDITDMSDYNIMMNIMKTMDEMYWNK